MSDLYDVRLNIQDPYGVLYFEEVASLPDPLQAQTAYVIVNAISGKNEYFVDGKLVELKISDDRINGWLAETGATVESVTLKSLRVCRSYLKQELILKKTASGAESEEYQDIKNMYDFYTSEIEDLEKQICKDKSPSGFKRYGKFRTPDFVCEV